MEIRAVDVGIGVVLTTVFMGGVLVVQLIMYHWLAILMPNAISNTFGYQIFAPFIIYLFLLAFPIYFVVDLFSPLRWGATKPQLVAGKPSNTKVTVISYIITVVVFFQFIYGSYYAFAGCLGDSSLSESLYFSFLTYSTLGYSDSGISDICKPVAVTQSVMGLLSIGTLIAALTSFSKIPD